MRGMGVSIAAILQETRNLVTAVGVGGLASVLGCVAGGGGVGVGG